MIKMKPMNDNFRVFIDSNIFIYLYSESEIYKQETAHNCMENYNCVISTQVLNEFCNICLKKFGKSINEIKLAIEEITEVCSVLLIEIDDILYATRLHEKYGYGYWDCLMLVSALKSGCKYIFTEDMQNGQIIENILTIKNVFI